MNLYIATASGKKIYSNAFKTLTTEIFFFFKKITILFWSRKTNSNFRIRKKIAENIEYENRIFFSIYTNFKNILRDIKNVPVLTRIIIDSNNSNKKTLWI